MLVAVAAPAALGVFFLVAGCLVAYAGRGLASDFAASPAPALTVGVRVVVTRRVVIKWGFGLVVFGLTSILCAASISAAPSLLGVIFGAGAAEFVVVMGMAAWESLRAAGATK